jgi:hypothetical protein
MPPAEAALANTSPVASVIGGSQTRLGGSRNHRRNVEQTRFKTNDGHETHGQTRANRNRLRNTATQQERNHDKGSRQRRGSALSPPFYLHIRQTKPQRSARRNWVRVEEWAPQLHKSRSSATRHTPKTEMRTHTTTIKLDGINEPYNGYQNKKDRKMSARNYIANLVDGFNNSTTMTVRRNEWNDRRKWWEGPKTKI